MKQFKDVQGVILKEGDYVVVNHATKFFATLAVGRVTGFEDNKVIIKTEKFGFTRRSNSQEVCRITKWTS